MNLNNNFFKIEHLSKRFGSTVALNDVSLSLRKGEVRGLIGENGSGKSTLCSIISGIYNMDRGKMYKEGKLYSPQTPIEANNLGVAMVVQELGVIETLTVAENIFLGRTHHFSNKGLLNIKKMRKNAENELNKCGISNVRVDNLTDTLSIEERKLVELVRALSVDPDILILDEITQALSHDNRELLYKIIDECIKRGKTIILVTHNVEEMLKIADNITVLRDGNVVGTVKSDEITADGLKTMMIGRNISGEYYREDNQESFQEDIVLSVENLGGGKIRNISFDLHKGEILAVCGLSDAGIHDLGKSIYGMVDGRVGNVIDVNTGQNLLKPKDVVNAKGAYVPKDRDNDGLMINASVKDNLFMPSAKELANKINFIAPKKIKNLVNEAVISMSIKTYDPYQQKVKNLSGGNKQKVNLGKWLIKDLNFIILDCPTRGVDIGVKAYIYNKMLKAKKEGLSIILITDELPEAIGMADRIIVLKDGSISKIFKRSEIFTEQSIVEVMM